MCFWRYRSITGQLKELKEIIMATREENQANIDALTAQAEKGKQEILDQVAKLEEAAAAGQELDFTALRAAVQGIDDLNPDAVTEPETPAEPELPVVDGEEGEVLANG